MVQGWTPRSTQDFLFSVTGLAPQDYVPNAGHDLLFTVAGSNTQWQPKITQDFLFTIEGTVSDDDPNPPPTVTVGWVASTSDDLALTVNVSRHLMLLEKNLKRMESSRANADLTHHKLTLGDQDTTTGWYAKTFTEDTIKGSIQPKGVTVNDLPVGSTAKYDLTLFTTNPIQADDEIEDTAGQNYIVRAVEEYWNLDRFSHYQASLEKRGPYKRRPTTSGVWSSTIQAQTDIKYWLTSNLNSTNLTLDDGTTPANYIIAFGKTDYAPEHVFFTKRVDLIFSVGAPTVDQAGDYEDLPITVYTVNKSGITAANLQWKIEAELRRIAAASPLGLYRSFLKVSPDQTVDTRIKSATYNLAYYPSVSATHISLTWAQ
jgi:hypothetical protein